MYQQNLTNQPCPHNVPHSPLRSKFTRPAGSLSRRTHVPHFLFPETAWGTFDLTASELLTMQFLFSMFQVQNRPFGVWALRSAQACWTKGGNFFILFKMLSNLIVQSSKLDCTSLLVDNVGLNNDIVARVVRALIYQASWDYLLKVILLCMFFALICRWFIIVYKYNAVIFYQFGRWYLQRSQIGKRMGAQELMGPSKFSGWF